MTDEEIKFDIYYNLRKDLLAYDDLEDILSNDGSQQLKILALFRIIPKCFSPELLITYSLPIYSDISDLETGKDIKISKYRWGKIEKVVVKNAQSVIQVPMLEEIQEVTHFVGNQIFIFISKIRYPIFILRTILESLVYTWQGTINSKETYLKALRKGNFSNEVKFYILCKTFMHERLIRKYFRRLSERTILEFIEEEPIIEEFIPVYFWVCRFTGLLKNIETTLHLTPDGENVQVGFKDYYHSSPIDYLFLWALFSFNDMAFEFIWKRFTSRAVDRDNSIKVIRTLAINDYRMANIVMYLLSKISESEIEIFSNSNSTIFFEYLLQLRWQGSFHKLLNTLCSNFTTETYIKIFKHMVSVICSPRNDKVSRRVLKEFLSKMSFAAKCKFLDDYDSLFYKLFQKFYRQKDLESCSVLLEINGPLNADNLFSTNLGTILFDMHIYDLKFNAIDDILKYSLTTLRPVNVIKTKYFKERAIQQCHKFISFKEMESLNLFINWCLSFISIKDVLLLKSDILLVEDGKLLKKLLFNDEPREDFQFLDEVLEWCFGQENLIAHLKSCIRMVKEAENHDILDPQIINIYTDIKSSFEKCQLRFLRQLFKWKPCTEEEVSQIKNSMLNDTEIWKIILRKRNKLNFFSTIFFLGLKIW